MCQRLCWTCGWPLHVAPALTAPARWDLGKTAGQSAGRPGVSSREAPPSSWKTCRYYSAPATAGQVGVGAEPGTDSASWKGRESFMEETSRPRSGEEQRLASQGPNGEGVGTACAKAQREHRAFRDPGWTVSQRSREPNPLTSPPWAWMSPMREELEKPGVTSEAPGADGPALCGPDVGPVLPLAGGEALRMHNVRRRGARHHSLGQGVLPGSSRPQAPGRPWRHRQERG